MEVADSSETKKKKNTKIIKHKSKKIDLENRKYRSPSSPSS
jgi:hypothetical protein